jgi:hypothetical protein
MADLPPDHNAQHAGFADSLMIGLDEVTAALVEAIADLDDKQVAALPVAGRNNIAWIVMHCLENLGWFGCACLGGKMPVEHADRWAWQSPRPRAEETFPTAKELRLAVARVRQTVLDNFSGVSDDELRAAPGRENKSKATRADCCIRTIWHTAAHVRQIWFICGALGLTDAKSWPRQHWS